MLKQVETRNGQELWTDGTFSVWFAEESPYNATFPQLEKIKEYNTFREWAVVNGFANICEAITWLTGNNIQDHIHKGE